MRPDDFVELFRKYLKSRGLHITRARERIVEEVSHALGHFDAASLWAKLQPYKIAPATIYRTLELLVQAGLVRKLVLDDRISYEAGLVHPHHEHLICDQCGLVVEFHDGRLEERLAEIVESHKFSHLSHQVIIRGVCPGCRGQAAENKPSGLGGPEACR